MHNLRTRGPWDKQHFENLASTLDSTLSDCYYRKWFPNEAMQIDDSTATTVTRTTYVGGGAEKYGIAVFPDADVTAMTVCFPKPKLWISGNIYVNVHWVDPDGVVNANYYISHNLAMLTSGSATNAVANVSQEVSTRPVRHSYNITQLTKYWPVKNEHDAVRCLIERTVTDAKDSSTADFNLVGLEFVYVPGPHTIGVTP